MQSERNKENILKYLFKNTTEDQKPKKLTESESSKINDEFQLESNEIDS